MEHLDQQHPQGLWFSTGSPVAPLHDQPQCRGPFLAHGSPARQGQTPWREDALVAEVGIHHTFPPIPTHPVPQQAPGSCPCAQWIQNPPHGGARQGEGVCWQVQGSHGSLSPVLALRCSAAGEFFPEAAQVAYRMWELSAVKVEVSTPSPPAPLLCCLPAWDSWLLLSAMGHSQPHTSALSLAPWLLWMPFSGFGIRG